MNTKRRDFIKTTLALGIGASTLGASQLGAASQALSPRIKVDKNPYSFYGPHQQGIATPAQKHIYFMVLDLHTNSLEEIRAIFKIWTIYSAKLTSGQNVGEYTSNKLMPTLDTGEADSLGSEELTLTFGVSTSFFAKLGLDKLKPKELQDLPHFPRDQLRPEFSGGDICIQACSNDPQVAFHAVRNLVRVARLQVTMKWSQMGFNSFMGGDTPRNLFGFKDGTINPKASELDKVVWIKGGPFDGGTYLAIRKVQMHLETWDRTHLKGQNDTFGRYRDSGAPYGGAKEFDEADVGANTPLPANSHVFLSKSAGAQILRRSFSYASGVDAKTGQFDAGLLFIAFQKDPEQFIRIQSALGNVDRMNEYITHIGSGLFACFGGVSDKKGDYLGKSILG